MRWVGAAGTVFASKHWLWVTPVLGKPNSAIVRKLSYAFLKSRISPKTACEMARVAEVSRTYERYLPKTLEAQIPPDNLASPLISQNPTRLLPEPDQTFCACHIPVRTCNVEFHQIPGPTSRLTNNPLRQTYTNHSITSKAYKTLNAFAKWLGLERPLNGYLECCSPSVSYTYSTPRYSVQKPFRRSISTTCSRIKLRK